MTSDRKAAIKRLRLLSFTPKSDVAAFRDRIENEYASPILPNKVECIRRELGGVVCDVLSPELYSAHKIILYIHGGSFVGGSAFAYRAFCARLSNKTLCRVVIPDFRLAPNAFPVSIKDVQNVFCALFAEEQVSLSLDGGGTPQVVIAADGSGASIAYSLLMTLKEKYRTSVPLAVFLSPWLDISDESTAFRGKGRDEVMLSEGMKKASSMYADAENRNSSLCSIHCCTKEELLTLPPIFIQMGEKEILLEEVKRQKNMLDEAGAHCTLDVWPSMMHLFQLSDDLMWDCHLAIEKIGKVVTAGDDEKEGAQRFVNHPPLESSI